MAYSKLDSPGLLGNYSGIPITRIVEWTDAASYSLAARDPSGEWSIWRIPKSQVSVSGWAPGSRTVEIDIPDGDEPGTPTADYLIRIGVPEALVEDRQHGVAPE